MARGDRDIEVEGVILRLRDYAESHRILEVLTPSHGRMSVFARGGRASRRRFRGALDLFVGLRMQCAASRDAWTLSAADVVSARTGLRRSLEQLQCASLLAECGALLSVENAPTPGLYESLCRGLDLCAAGELVAAVVALPRMVTAAGIGLDTTSCVRCGRPTIEFGTVDIAASGVACERCSPNGERVPLAALSGESEELSPAEARALEEGYAAWIEAHTGRRLRSRARWAETVPRSR
jgi:DNA repair protein RecO (recombination protein O)